MSPSLPLAETPLYNHTLPDLEQWLSDHGCDRDDQELHLWHLRVPDWAAEIRLDIEELSVTYQLPEGQKSVRRTFKYSLSRQDVEEAVFAGP